MRAVLGEHAPDALEHRDDGGLVVAAEDRRAAVAHDPVLDDRLDRVDRRHRVEVGAEEERLAVPRRLERDVDVPHRRADGRAGVVLVRVEPEIAEIAEDAVGDGALLAGRARDGGELEEEVESL